MLTKEDRIAILEVAGKTFNGQEPFELYLGKLTQYVTDGIYKEVYKIDYGNKTDEGETQDVLS